MKNSNKPATPAGLAALLLSVLLALAACGGGDSTSSPALPQAQTPSPPFTPDTGPNVVPVSVKAGPSNTVNLLFTSVTVCTPGTSDCRTIDDVLVDSGSAGLRLFASEITPALNLPQQLTENNQALAECAQFADGSTWGTVRVADVHLGERTAASVPVHIMGDTSFGVPGPCLNTGPQNNTPQSFTANGVLGIGSFLQDCGLACEQSPNVGIYYACSTVSCVGTLVPRTQQVQNPVALFATDNNGIVMKLPSVPLSGAPTVSGSLVFGIGTQSNNALGSAQVFTTNPQTGFFTVDYKGTTYRQSFIDSGSNGIFFFDDSIPQCNRAFYCPPAPLSLSAVNRGLNGTSNTVNFVIVNAEDVFRQNRTATAIAGLAGPGFSSDTFSWGLPFFYGRSVFTAIEGRSTPGGTGPYFAY